MNKWLMCIILGIIVLSSAAFAQTRTIRYDGHLERDRVAVNGPAALGFSLYDSAAPGNAPQSIQAVVTSGVFSVELGAAPQPALPASVFAAATLFVETAVDGTTLQPRRSVGAVPFAVHADNGVPPGSLLAFFGADNQVPVGCIRDRLRISHHCV